MKFTSFLNPHLIIINSEIDNKDKAIELLVDKIIEVENIELNREYIVDKLMEREKMGSTIIGDGVFIPHARLENYNDLHIAVLIPQNPIDKKIKLIFLVLISNTTSTIYLGALSAISQIASNSEIYENLLNVRNVYEFIDILNKHQIKIKKEIHAQDIMKKEFITVNENITVKELLDIFYMKNILYTPVVNENNDFIGEIHILYILQNALPDYTAMLSNLKFITSIEPLNKFLKEEKTTYIKDIMRKPDKVLKPNSSIIEAISYLRNGCKDIPVIENNKIVGIVNCRQLLHKVLRA